MDMGRPFMSAVGSMLPQADIVHDRFHISKYLDEAVNKVRYQEHRELSQAGSSPLAGSNYSWMKS